VADTLWVLSPLVLPLPHQPWAVALNRRLLRAQIGRACRRLGLERPQVWTFLPNAVDYALDLDPSLLVYYCVDDWAHSAVYDGARLAVLEERLCARANLVFATSQALAEGKRRLNPRTHLAVHGVDHAHFSRALDPGTPDASELAALRGRIVGMVGLIDERVDLSLLAYVAARHPDWEIVLVGPVATDLGPLLAAHRNVHVLGRWPYARLPEVLRRFAAALVPFVVNEYTRHVNPLKLREYLSAGVPVVGTDLPEIARHARWCRVGRTPIEFVSAIETAIAEDSAVRRAARSAAMRGETWERRVDEIGRIVAQARETHAA
jgi:glycosyltransferase involved in cell wall biosynthesis